MDSNDGLARSGDDTGQAEGDLDVLLGGERGEEVGVLEHHADAFAAQAGTGGFVHGCEVVVEDEYLALGWVIQADQDVE